MSDPEGPVHTPVGNEVVDSRIYAASLSDYNAGRLHGEWIDAAQEVEELELAVQAMLARSREPVAEEWAIHDSEGFAPLDLFEYTPLRLVSRIALGIIEHGPAFAVWADLLEPRIVGRPAC